MQRKQVHDIGTQDLMRYYTFGQSPKVSLTMVSELQDKVRENEGKIAAMGKTISRLQTENSDLMNLAHNKDKELQKVVEEILRLKKTFKTGEKIEGLGGLSKGNVTKSQNLHKMRNFYLERSNKLESDVRSFKAVFEEEKNRVEQKLKAFSEREKEFLGRIDGLEKENLRLEAQVRSFREENGLGEFEKLAEENQDLKKQLEIIRKAHNLHDLAMLSPDIHQISYQIRQLLTILQSLRVGKDISLRLLLSIDETTPISSSKQLISDVAELKKDLNIIKQIISDYHAENLGFSMCITQ